MASRQILTAVMTVTLLAAGFAVMAGLKRNAAAFTVAAPAGGPAPEQVADPENRVRRDAAVGINLTSVLWYSNERAFSNLALGGFWQFARPGGWSDLLPPHVAPDGSLLSLPEGGDAVRMLTMPATPPQGSLISCSYEGRGDVTARGDAKDVVVRPGEVRFRWVNLWRDNVVWIQVHAVDSKAPIKGLDCRESGASRNARFDPAFVAGLRGFKVLRFMDWQRTNENASVRWSARHTPSSLDLVSGSGVAVEDLVALAREVDADLWVTSPWNADDDYIARFAQALHDGVPQNHRVYVEVGNEVWNGGFPVARQALAEGQRLGLGRNPREIQMRRYAQRTIETMRIWERRFVDAPRRLVRVVSTQHVVPSAAEVVFSFPGLADHVDALATAPYFGQGLQEVVATHDLGKIFSALDASINISLNYAKANQAVAARYGKRYLAYEAGQHLVIPEDVSLLAQIQRDPRMYSVYQTYLAAWRTKIGDTIMLFASTGRIGPSGAWGLAEHSGQEIGDAPKLRAAFEARKL